MEKKEELEKEQLMKFKVEDNKLKMEIKINDLLWLFKSSEVNFDGRDGQIAKVKKDKKEEFVKFLIEYLQDYNKNNENITNWAGMFEDAFYEVVEGYYDFCKYMED